MTSRYGDEPAQGRDADLRDVLNQLVEAQIMQTNLLQELVNATTSLARSETRESLVDVVRVLSEVKSNQVAVNTAPPACSPVDVSSTARFAVLAQYDEMRAALGRTAGSFYATAYASHDARTITINASQPVVQAATDVTVGDRRMHFTKVGLTELLVGDMSFSESEGQPPIRLWSGERLTAIAHYVSPSCTSVPN